MLLCDFVPFPRWLDSLGHGFRESTPENWSKLLLLGQDTQEVEPKPHLCCKIINDYREKNLWNIHIMYRICSTLGCLFLGSSLSSQCRFAIPSVFPRIIVGRWVFVLFTIIIRSSLLPRRGPRLRASHRITPKCLFVCVSKARFDI